MLSLGIFRLNGVVLGRIVFVVYEYDRSAHMDGGKGDQVRKITKLFWCIIS